MGSRSCSGSRQDGARREPLSRPLAARPPRPPHVSARVRRDVAARGPRAAARGAQRAGAAQPALDAAGHEHVVRELAAGEHLRRVRLVRSFVPCSYSVDLRQC